MKSSPPPRDRPRSLTLWDEVLRLHRAHGRPGEARRAALLVGDAVLAPEPWRLALDAVVVLGWSREDGAPAAPRVRVARRHGGSAVTVLGALVEVLIASPDTHVAVVTPRGATRDAPVDRAVQRALVAAESDPEAIVVVTGARGAPPTTQDATWLVPTGPGAVRPAAVVHAPRDRASARRLESRGAVRDLGIAVAHGKALFDLFAREHPLLVRMFTFAAALPPEEREPYLDSACRDLDAPAWSAALLGACPRLRIVTVEPGDARTFASGVRPGVSAGVSEEHPEAGEG